LDKEKNPNMIARPITADQDRFDLANLETGLPLREKTELKRGSDRWSRPPDREGAAGVACPAQFRRDVFMAI
jgi:hypothetical protein